MVFQTFSSVLGIMSIIHGLTDYSLFILRPEKESKVKNTLTAGSLQVTARLGKSSASQNITINQRGSTP